MSLGVPAAYSGFTGFDSVHNAQRVQQHRGVARSIAATNQIGGDWSQIGSLGHAQKTLRQIVSPTERGPWAWPDAAEFAGFFQPFLSLARLRHGGVCDGVYG